MGAFEPPPTHVFVAEKGDSYDIGDSLPQRA
jgi:hypothetical protein